MPSATETPDTPCDAPATRMILRGKTARLFKCGEHIGLYHGGGKVVSYLGKPDWAPGERSEIPGLYLGPPRTCGEAIQ